ncbi:hypothetical protein [Providencia sp. PROV113]|uniref:hypothetical protein n=1 Tax=Providencia sp. PROV113 TaxID=2949824 RepID=UPI003FA68CD8
MRAYPSPLPVTDTRILTGTSKPGSTAFSLAVRSVLGLRSQLVLSSQRPAVSGGKLLFGPDQTF